MNRTQVRLYYKRFREGRQDNNYDVQPGHPSTTITDVIIELLMMVAYRSGFVRTDILDTKRAAEKIVPKLLHFEQKYVT